MLSFFSNDHSLNPAEIYNFSLKLLPNRTKINKKRPGMAHLKTVWASYIPLYRLVVTDLDRVADRLDDQFFRFKVLDVDQDLVDVIVNLWNNQSNDENIGRDYLRGLPAGLVCPGECCWFRLVSSLQRSLCHKNQ